MDASDRRPRPSALSAPVLAIAVLAGCTAADEDKAGSPTAVEVRMANAYSSLEFEPAVQAFVTGVDERSGGRMRIQVVNDFGGEQPDLEQRVLAGVADGEADLGWVGTRVLDTVGVDAFAALTAPFLINSYALQEAVLESDLPGRLLPALEDAGVTGLAVLAGGLRHPVSVTAPLATAADWQGATFQTFRSQGQSDAIAALGATPTDIVFGDLTRALENGTVTGSEKSLLVYSINKMEAVAPHIVDDVVLWPETSVLFANPDLEGRLTDEQWAWLRDAAASTAEQSPRLADTDQDLARELCSRGVRFTSAGPDALQELESAAAQAHAALQQDPHIADDIAAIRRLAEGLPAARPFDVPDWCRDTSTAGRPGQVSSTVDTLLVGSWETGPIPPERVRATFLEAGGSERDADDFVAQLQVERSVQFRIDVTDQGWTQYQRADGGAATSGWSGTYTVDGSTVHAVEDQSGCRIDYAVTADGDTLTLQVLRDCTPEDLHAQRAIYESAPFIRTS